jgi:putative intracellular protease/amidase
VATIQCGIVDDPDFVALLESFYNSSKPVAAVCYSLARIPSD